MIAGLLHLKRQEAETQKVYTGWGQIGDRSVHTDFRACWVTLKIKDLAGAIFLYHPPA